MLIQNPRATFTVLDGRREDSYDRRRHRRERSQRTELGPVSSGRVKFKLVPMPGMHPWGGMVSKPKPDDRVANLCGSIAMGSVVFMWVIGLFGCLDPNGTWADLVFPSIGLAFILTHLLGFLSDGLSESRCPWGMMAFGSFWVSLLVWIPLGVLIHGMNAVLMMR